MTAVPRSGLRPLAWTGVVALLAPALGCSPQNVVAVDPPDPAAEYDVTPRPISVVPPGAVVGDGPPEGWTHLLIKSYPRAGAGDLDKLSSSMRELADKLFTTMLARVEVVPGSSPPRYRLADVASGVGTSIDGRDVVISPKTYAQQGANMGFFGGWAVEAAYGRIKAAAIVLRSDTLAVYDAPMIMVRDGRHAPVMLRYVFLLDPATGAIDTLQWFIDLDDKNAYLEPHGPMELLRRGHVEVRVIHVDAGKLGLGGILTEQALALTKLYTGRRQIPFPDDFHEPARLRPFTAESAAAFEQTLRRLVRQADGP